MLSLNWPIANLVNTHRLQSLPLSLILASVYRAHLCAQVGDGNINFVFIVEGPAGGVAIKQSLPYIRCVGESWPLTQVRMRVCIWVCVWGGFRNACIRACSVGLGGFCQVSESQL